jgi:hypothetical protein
VASASNLVSGATVTNPVFVGTATLNASNLMTTGGSLPATQVTGTITSNQVASVNPSQIYPAISTGVPSSVLPTNNITDVAPNPGSFVYYKSGTNYTAALNMIYSNMTFYANSNGILTPLFSTNGVFASALTGTIPAEQLPSVVVTNNSPTAYALNGGGVTNLSGPNLVGTLNVGGNSISAGGSSGINFTTGAGYHIYFDNNGFASQNAQSLGTSSKPWGNEYAASAILSGTITATNGIIIPNGGGLTVGQTNLGSGITVGVTAPKFFIVVTNSAGQSGLMPCY